MIRIFTTGAHAHRSPLSYPALAPLWAGQIEHVETPEEADLYVLAHSLDVNDAPRRLVEDWRRRRRPVVLLSEEPFWDTIWGRRPLCRDLIVDTDFGALPVIQLNHHTSTIYKFRRIPYYLLTNHRFANAYAARFHRNAALNAADWLERFAARSTDVTFMFERRSEPHHDVSWPDGDILGLCAWRTRLAEVRTEAVVERLGRSWNGGCSRFEIDDWHMDKLTRLDDHTRLLAAIENTHQPDYITEKLFDAFACGAVPLYYASPRHRIHEFGLPAEAWINLFPFSPDAAAQRIASFAVSADIATAFAEAQKQLCLLFGNIRLWVEERQRLAIAVRQELEQILGDA